jgi:hypothetical protein
MALAAITMTAISSSSLAQTSGASERFTASAINVNRGTAGNVEIVIDRWSSDAERDRLLAVMLERGPEKLLDVLQDLPKKGFFRASSDLGWNIQFARHRALPDKGERVVLVTDRRIDFWEATQQPRSIDYPFTVIEMQLDGDGVGVGKISVATKIIVDKDNNTITLENFDLQPVQLTNVKRDVSRKNALR